MKNSTMIIMIILVVAVVGGFLIMNSKSEKSDELPSNTQNGEAQNVVLSMKDYNYYPSTITVKANEPVRISLDKSVYGCFRYFTIPDLKVNKNLRTPSDYVEFTPTQTGTYRFQCGMGMGYGTLIVN